MELGQFTEFGVAGIFIAACYKLYTDMRTDGTTRENKLMEHMDKQSETMSEISGTLKSMDGRICSLEEYCRSKKEGESE
jgi:hypothetical protein